MESKHRESSLWAIIDPLKMFPNMPPTIAIISYSCVILGVFIAILICIWLCSAFGSRGRPRKSIGRYKAVKEAKSRKNPWSVTNNDRGREIEGKTNEAFEMDEKGGRCSRQTLDRLDTMPWWDYVSNNPSVNWYNYYRMAEGCNRARTCGRKRYPWQSGGSSRDVGVRYHTRSRSENTRRLLPRSSSEVDSLWENVHPHPVDPRCWRRPSVDNSFFPRFRMIPRATWIDGRMMACLGQHEYGGDCANHSMTSLTSTDMQIMQMVAKRHQYLRPSRGDVFYGQHAIANVERNPSVCRHSGCLPRYPTPYDTHNEDVSRRHEIEESARAARPRTSTPMPSPRDTDMPMRQRPPSPPPPSPPGYPPPPTPMSLRRVVQDSS